MKIRLRLLAITVTLALLLMPATALAQPVVPLQYHGSVTIDEVDALTGTIITAEIDEEEVATNAPGGTTAVGTYELDVVADEGDTVVLKVTGVVGGQTTHPDPSSTWHVVLNLSVGEAPPPSLTANAGELTYHVAVGEELTLAGSASGGTSPYTYDWDLDEDGEYDDATGASPSHSWETAGTYTISLRVTDDADDTATDTASVVVSEEGAFDPYTYDENEDDVISKAEAQAAVDDYGTGTRSKANALAVVKLYFS